MKAEKLTVYGVFHADDSGYSCGQAVAWYPMKAAASADPQYKDMRGYGSISAEKAIRLGDEIYVYDEELNDSRKFVGNIPLYVPTDVYKDYAESYNGPHNTKYIEGNENLIAHIDTKDLSSSISKKIVLRDENGYFILKQKEPIMLAKFSLSREMAVQNALDKLTDEEQKLLGLK
jgi:hypothetical protein